MIDKQIVRNVLMRDGSRCDILFNVMPVSDADHYIFELSDDDYYEDTRINDSERVFRKRTALTEF